MNLFHLKNSKLHLLVLIFLFPLLSFSQTNSVLFYEQAAEKWEEALPLGNGKIGFMIYGDPHTEHFQLNDDSLWPADLGWDEPEGNANDLKEIREALFQGDHKKADALFVEKFSRKKVLRSHQSLGDLFIEFEHENITEYRRELDLSTAITKVTYKTNGAQIKEEIFVSNPQGMMAIKITSDSEEGLNAKIRFSRPKDHGHPTVTSSVDQNHCLIMQGEVTQRGGFFDSKPAPILEGVKFESRLKVLNKGGKVLYGKDYLELRM